MQVVELNTPILSRYWLYLLYYVCLKKIKSLDIIIFEGNQRDIFYAYYCFLRWSFPMILLTDTSTSSISNVGHCLKRIRIIARNKIHLPCSPQNSSIWLYNNPKSLSYQRIYYYNCTNTRKKLCDWCCSTWRFFMNFLQILPLIALTNKHRKSTLQH